MRGVITKIHLPKKSFNGGYYFQRIDLKLEDGRWAKTDLCPSFRNYKNWEKLLHVGTEIKGIRVKGGVRVMTIDADSDVSLYSPPNVVTASQPTLFDE